MEGGEFSLSGSCMPCSGMEDTSFKHSDLNGYELIHTADNTRLKEVVVEAIQTDDVVNRGEVGLGSTPPVLEQEKGLQVAKGKRRGRPRMYQLRITPIKKVKDEEDVCFICFDGGSLVLCDRRGCPKAYHPVCVKRDDTFFRAKSKWNCGWHICSTCEKPAHYMCYTCTYSLCKKCSRGADFLCVRENKGFCSLCIRTIMLIENKEQREMDKIDFDDKTSWEYLFKMYWLYIKGKLSLSLDEISKAKNLLKPVGSSARKGTDLVAVSGSNDGKGHISDDFVVNRLRSKKINQKIKLSQFICSPSINKPGSSDLCTSVSGSANWASKELLAFVTHVKNGDESEISPHDAYDLLLDYVQRNDLRDQNQTSQILCDTRLAKLFGKPRVGHFEMLKLLEFHFPMKDDSPKVVSRCNINPVIVREAEGNGSNDLLLRSNDKKRKNYNGPSTDPSEYAAIDVHNINLIYLRRALLESLVNNIDKFHENVVGSIVRVRFSGCDEKPEMFGLVQVIGTCKVPIPYKIGEKEKMVDVVLEIFNMDKKETISIDAVSDEKFSEEECKKLKESIKCGFVKHLTVGQIQEKAKALREVIANDCLETEVLQLIRLRDGANENGHEDMLREYVERLELLKSPEEIERRLKGDPEVHIDPSLNQNNKSAKHAEEVDNKREVKHLKTEHPVLNKNGIELIPLMNAEGSSKSTANDHPTSVTQGLDKPSPNAEDERPGSRVVDSSGSAVGGCNSPAVISSASFSGVVSENSTGSPPFSHTNENENFWRYRDPKGKQQGPFSLSQLRKWYTSGLLPLEMRTWSIYDDETDSLLLSDVLKGQQSQKLSSRQSSISLLSQGVSENGSNSGLTSTVLDKSVATTPTYKCVDINKTSSPGWDSHKVNVHSDPTNNPVTGKLDLNSSFSPTTNCENDIPVKPCEDNVHIEGFGFQIPGNQPDIEEVDNNTILVPASDMNSWLQMLTEPIEFNTLDEESVSDLLDQVDAMESRVDVDFPSASLNNSVDYLFEDLSSQPDNAKVDHPESSSSTRDIINWRPEKTEGFMNPPPWTQMTPQPNAAAMNRTCPVMQMGWGSQSVKVCEFYGSGQCMKGAFCEYLHQ